MMNPFERFEKPSFEEKIEREKTIIEREKDILGKIEFSDKAKEIASRAMRVIVLMTLLATTPGFLSQAHAAAREQGRQSVVKQEQVLEKQEQQKQTTIEKKPTQPVVEQKKAQQEQQKQKEMRKKFEKMLQKNEIN